jgi:hypothetical protein
MVDQRIDAAIRTESSHIQVLHQEYLNNPDKKFVIPNADSVAGIIRSVEGVKAVSNRSLSAP